MLREYPDRRLLFVATGTGIAPIRSMLHARLPSPTPVTLIWGLRHERDIYYQNELAELAAEFPEFSGLRSRSRSRQRHGPARSAACSPTSNPISRPLTI